MGGAGIELNFGGLIEDVLLTGNGTKGVQSSSGAVIVRGTGFSFNVDDGIEATFATISGSKAACNGGDGFDVGYSSGNLIGNTADFNGGIGIVAGPGSSNTLNSVRGNGGLGMSMAADSSFGSNAITCNNGGVCDNSAQTTGGISMGFNLCGTDTTCP